MKYNRQYNRRGMDYQPFGPILSTCYAEPGECSLKPKPPKSTNSFHPAIRYEILENPSDK